MERPSRAGGLPNEAEKKVNAGPSNDATDETPTTAVVHELSKDEPDEDRFSTASGATFATATGELLSSVKHALADTNEKATTDDEDNEIGKALISFSPIRGLIQTSSSLSKKPSKSRAASKTRAIDVVRCCERRSYSSMLSRR